MKLRADRDSYGSIGRTHGARHGPRLSRDSICSDDDDDGDGDGDNVESWVNFLFRRPPELVSTALSVAYGERCSTISDRSTTRCRCRVRRLSKRMMNVADLLMLLVHCENVYTRCSSRFFPSFFFFLFFSVAGEIRRWIVQVVSRRDLKNLEESSRRRARCFSILAHRKIRVD